MLEKLQAVASRYEELCAKAEQPDFYADPARAAKLLKERNELEPIAEAYTALRQAQQEQEEARELLAGETVSVRQGNGSQITGKVENSAAAQGPQ